MTELTATQARDLPTGTILRTISVDGGDAGEALRLGQLVVYQGGANYIRVTTPEGVLIAHGGTDEWFPRRFEVVTPVPLTQIPAADRQVGLLLRVRNGQARNYNPRVAEGELLRYQGESSRRQRVNVTRMDGTRVHEVGEPDDYFGLNEARFDAFPTPVAAPAPKDETPEEIKAQRDYLLDWANKVNTGLQRAADSHSMCGTYDAEAVRVGLGRRGDRTWSPLAGLNRKPFTVKVTWGSEITVEADSPEAAEAEVKRLYGNHLGGLVRNDPTVFVEEKS